MEKLAEQYVFDMLSRKTIRNVERVDSTRISIFFTDGTAVGLSAYSYPVDDPWDSCSTELEIETF